MRRNESGLTLVEVLATLVLLSMVGAIVWTAFFIAAKHNIAETKKVHLQQEANLILTKIQQQHRKLDCYEVIIEEGLIQLVNCESEPPTTKVLGSNYKYQGCESQDEDCPGENEYIPEENDYSSGEIQPKQNDLSFKLIVRDPKQDSKLKVEVETTIARYQSSN